MILAGMNVARLNFSHGSYENFALIIKNLRAVSRKLNIPIAIMQDLQGPKIRVGNMPDQGIVLKKGQTITLTNKSIIGNHNLIPVQYKHLYKDLSKNDKILINDGMIELKVSNIKNQNIICRVIIGGLVQSHKGINVPTASIKANPITGKDLADLNFGLKNDVDYVALSFVKNAKNIIALRNLIRRKKGNAKIIAKIERHEAVENLESIIMETDGVMVARGDLGTEVSPEKVPLIQKRMIHLANLHGKPVITATEMLLSMIENPRASRAEISDVANAVFDHTDAIMLSNESAVGKYPVQATQTLATVAAATENEIKKHELFLPNRLFKNNFPVSYGTCSAAAELAKDIGAKIIVAITLSGFTAQHLAKHRVYIPIVAFTESAKVQKQLQLVWGINEVIVTRIDFNNYSRQVRKFVLSKKMAKKGDKIVIVINASKEEKLISTIII